MHLTHFHKTGHSPFIALLATKGGERPSIKRSAIMETLVFFRRCKYWLWGGIAEAGALVRGIDTARHEYLTGLGAIGVGIWWAIFPQPHYNVFGIIEASTPHLPGFVWGMALIILGRNVLHQLTRGTRASRAGAARYMAAGWAFLFVNQALTNPTSAGTVLWFLALYKTFLVHDYLAPRRKPRPPSSPEDEDAHTHTHAP